MEFSEKQKEYFLKATHRWNVKCGATRSGKTFMDYFLIPMRLRKVRNRTGLNVILGNTKSTLRRNIIEPMREIWGSRLVGDIRSDNTAVLFGETVYCLGAEKISHVDKLRGSSIKYCYGDEIVTWHEEVFDMLKSRLDKDYSIFDGTCNPESPNHWFKRFLDDDKIDLFAQSYRIDDNPFLSEGVRDNLKKEYSGTVYYDRYILGKWTLAQGLVYPFFSAETMCFDRFAEGSCEWYVSVDYGTQNPCVMLLWAVDLSAGRAYLVKEFYYDGRKTQKQKTDSEYYEDLRNLCKDREIECVIVDPSASSFKAEIRKHGEFSCRNADNKVVDGIRLSASLLKKGSVLISRDCKETINEFCSYCWDKNSAQDTVIKENDHAMDAFRYMSYTILKNLGF